jgi:pimeloyl-ACP methyl ester carboxylesterase
MHDFILALGLGKPGVIGHSMGAGNAAEFAAKYPEMLSCLVLEDPPWYEPPQKGADIKASMADRKEKNLAMKKKTVKELVADKRKNAPRREEETLRDWAEGKLNIDPTIFDMNPISLIDWHDLAKAIPVHTLIIAGDKELGAIVSPAVGIEAIKLLKHGEFGHISKAGHCVRYEQYQPYLTMLKLFLKRNA